MVAFDYGFPEEEGFFLIPYYCSIKLLLNSSPRNSPPRSYVISISHGFWTSHVVSTNFSIVIDFLLLYCVISNHRFTGYIIVTVFKSSCSTPFLRILYGPTRSSHSLLHGIYPANLEGNLPYFLLTET